MEVALCGCRGKHGVRIVQAALKCFCGCYSAMCLPRTSTDVDARLLGKHVACASHARLTAHLLACQLFGGGHVSMPIQSTQLEPGQPGLQRCRGQLPRACRPPGWSAHHHLVPGELKCVDLSPPPRTLHTWGRSSGAQPACLHPAKGLDRVCCRSFGTGYSTRCWLYYEHAEGSVSRGPNIQGGAGGWLLETRLSQ